MYSSMYSRLIVPLCALLYTATKVTAILLPTPTPTVSIPHSIVAPSPTITRAGWKDWPRSPQDQEIHTSNTCGFSKLIWWSCYDSLAICTNTLLENGHAYQYCSTPGASVQTYDTDVFDYSSWSFNSWPANRAYCPETSPHGITDIYTRDGLTVTGFDCGFYNESNTNTYLAASYMLDAASYSAAVKSLSSALAPPTTTPPTTTPHTTHTPPVSSGNDSGGLSTSAKIGIGAGVGGGVIAILVAVGLLCLRPWMKRRKAVSNSSPGSEGYGSQGRPTSYYIQPEKVRSPQLGSPDAPWYQSQYPPQQFQQQPQAPWQQQQGYQQQPQYQQQPVYQQTGYNEAPYQQPVSPQPIYQLPASPKPRPAELPGRNQ